MPKYIIEIETDIPFTRSSVKDAVRALLPHPITKPSPEGWISVKDRLPEDGQVVAFIIDKSVNYYGGSMCAGRFRYFDYGDIKLPEFGTWGLSGLPASHWMPLPEPPK